MKKRVFNLVFLFFILCSIHVSAQKQYDVVIYGGTSAGISSAIQSSRMGKTVALIEPTNRLGGLTTGGLGQTDIGNKQVVGSISREFYQNVKKYYNTSSNWKWQTQTEYASEGQSKTNKGEDAMWTFEPSAAMTIFKNMMAPEKINVFYGMRLNRETGVILKENKIVSIKMENGRVFKGKMFIDATYEGDLMAAAKVSYTVGREPNTQYGESLNGVQANRISYTIKKAVSRNGYNHNFVESVDPYVIKRNPASGLLPYVSDKAPGVDGAGDKKIQAYCFRMTLTDHPENRISFKKPSNYNELNYELLFRNYEAATVPLTQMHDYGNRVAPWINAPMPNRKTDTNNCYGFSTDFIGQNYDYPEASYQEREKIVKAHLDYQQGLMWTLAYHPRVPKQIRDMVSQWGTCKDEHNQKNDGWPDQLYIREARRMVSSYVMTQKNCEWIDVVTDPVGMAAYTMDSHHVQRYVDVNGFVKNEGNVEAPVGSPFPISYKSIVPKKEECSNLLVPICLSSTHIAFGSIRMEPVFMVLGQSAATAACQAIDEKCAVQDINYEKLNARLLKDNQILDNPK